MSGPNVCSVGMMNTMVEQRWGARHQPAVLDNLHCVGVSVWALSDKLKLNNWSLQFVTFGRHLCKVMKISMEREALLL